MLVTSGHIWSHWQDEDYVDEYEELRRRRQAGFDGLEEDFYDYYEEDDYDIFQGEL